MAMAARRQGLDEREVTAGAGGESAPAAVGCLVNVCVPFVTGRCDYLGRPVASDVRPADKHAYLDALSSEVRAAGAQVAARGMRVDAVSLGVGAVGTVEPDRMHELGKAMRSSLPLASAPDVSAEVDPGLLSTALLDELRQLGLTTLRVRYLTSDEGELARMGRPSTELEMGKTRIVLDAAGFHHLDMQVIVGMRDQTPASLERTLRDALLVDGVFHVTLVPASGPFASPDEGRLARDRALAVDLLSAHGFVPYAPRCLARAGRAGVGAPRAAGAGRGTSAAPEACGVDDLARIPEEDRRYASDGVVGLGSASISCFDGLMWQNVSDPAGYAAAARDPRAMTAQALVVDDRLVAARRLLDALYHLRPVPAGSIDEVARSLRGTLVGSHSGARDDAGDGGDGRPAGVSSGLLEDGMLEERPDAPSPSGSPLGTPLVGLSNAGAARYERVFARILGGA